MNRFGIGCALVMAAGCGDGPSEPGVDVPGVSWRIQQGAGPVIKLEGRTAQYVLFQDLSVLARVFTPAKAGMPATMFELSVAAPPVGIPLPATYDIANPGPLQLALTTLNTADERALADSGTITISDATPTRVQGSLSIRLSFFQTPNGPREPLRIHGRFLLESVTTLPPPEP